MMKRHHVGVVVLTLLATLALAAQSAPPSIGAARAGDQTVSGRAATDAVPLAIYDTWYSPQRLIGQGGSIDVDGNFAVAVDPPLAEGHRIVAVDALGRASASVVVQPPTGPASPTE